MKAQLPIIALAVVIPFAPSSFAQGTFLNLNFESANISGFSPNSQVPIANALPGWTGFYGSTPTSQVGYDLISLGATAISVIDKSAPVFGPLQGNYSAFLFGGAGNGGPASASISQTAVITAGTQSLLMDAWSYDASPIVAINAQPINMIPLQTFANYTLYGGNIPSADVGPSVTLSFTEPPPLTGGPSEFELDNISFSPTSVAPEPNPLILTGIGSFLFALHRRFRK
jgi:hypothetical protein